MGYWKNKLLEMEERGYSEIDTTVCHGCFGDYGLKNYIKKHGERNKCDYCKNNRKSMPLEDVIEYIIVCAETEYEDANGCMGWDKGEGGFHGADTWDTYDLIHEVLNMEMQIEDYSLLKDIYDTINDITWCEYDPYASRIFDKYILEWQKYASKVEKNSKKDDSYILDIICEYIKINKLVRRHDKKIGYFRGVVHNENEVVNTAKRIGSAPSSFSATNRMSEAGESVFYGADNIETCIKEIINNTTKMITLAKFYPFCTLTVLDLTMLGTNIPSLFDDENRHKRNSYIFLRNFSHEISKPVRVNETTKYIPTQKLAHFLKNKLNLDGIAYNSSKNSGDRCYILFFDNNACTDNPKARGHKLWMDKSTIIQKKF